MAPTQEETEHGDGITVTFHRNGDGYTRITAVDTLRKAEKSLAVRSWIVNSNRVAIRQWLLEQIAKDLNKRQMFE